MNTSCELSISYGRNFGTKVADYEKGRNVYSGSLLDYVIQKIQALNPCFLLDQIPVIDLGCGTGKSTEALYVKGLHNVRGLDVDSKMLAAARNKAYESIKLTVPQENYIEGAVSDLPNIFQGQKFTVVTAFSAFHWFCTVNEVNAIKTIMATNSIFIAGAKSDRTNYTPAQVKFFKMFEEITGSPVPNPFKNFHPVKVLKECGFEVDVEYFPKETVYTSETLKARARSFSGWCNMAEDQQIAAESKLQDLVEELIQEQGNNDGKYREITEEMCVTGYLKS